jgi:hypothetical protein
MMTEQDSNKKKFFQAVRRKILLKHIIGVILGGIAGYLYYRQVGCSTGACPMQSNPWLTTIWAAIVGYLLADLIPKKKKPADISEPDNQG